MRRVLVVIAVVVSGVLVAAGVLAYVTVHRSFPQTSGEVRLDGLRGEVTIERDGWGVPQVYADDERDLFLAQGYVHAQDRFFEMDFRRHVTAGRLAELVGDGGVETDVFVRTLGWRRVAEQEYDMLDRRTKSLLQAYARGVNAYLDDRSGPQLSLEYSILGLTGPDYRPEPWTPVDSVAWVKAMAWDLASNMQDEASRVHVAAAVGPDRAEELWPDYPEDHPTIVGDDEVAAQADDDAVAEDVAPASADASGRLDVTEVREALASVESASDAAAAVPTLLGVGEGIGSNSWVVSGEQSTTGHPILANDPHLAPSMPGIWYQVGLHCRKVDDACPYDVSGFSFSGMPGVVVGHNQRVAWGVTTMYADVADLYLERVSGDTYEFEGRQLPLETREETISVAGGDSRTITVRSTRHGPLLSDVDEQIAEVGQEDVPGVDDDASARSGERSRAVALRWTALTPRPTISAVFALGRAQDWSSFREAARLFTVPSQNLVYADVDGNIGYQAPGAIPVRTQGDGRWPVAGWTGEAEWSGYLDFDELPSVLNPDDGVIVTANNKVVGDDYPNLLGADTAQGYRAQRIEQLLQDRGQLSVDDMISLQSDARHPMAEQLVPLLQRIDLDDEFHEQGQATLDGWDQQMDADSSAAAYFAVVWRHVLDLAFHDELPRSQWPDGGERWYSVVSRMLDDESDPWWDVSTTPGVTERRDDILAEAMRRARDELTRSIARDTDQWSWGRLHRLTLVNQTLGQSGIGLVEGLFNRGPWELGGSGGLVDATGWDAAEGYEVTALPSMRMVVDLDDLDASRWINLTGASGHAFHDHYTDQTDVWARGETLPWAFSRDAVAETVEDTLTLRPAGS